MVIFNEIDYGKSLDEIEDKNITKIKDMMILIKYYRYKGLDEDTIRNKLYDRVYGIDESKISLAFKYCKDKTIKIPKEIVIYKEELDIIQNELNYEYQKLLFIMLCVCKFYHRKVHPNYLPIRAGTEIPMSKLIKLAGSKFTKEEKVSIGNYLYKNKYIDSLDWDYELFYYRDSGEEAMRFIPYPTMIFEFRKYIGENVVRCERCNEWVYKRSNRTKYCAKCAKEISKEKNTELVREKRKNEDVTI